MTEVKAGIAAVHTVTPAAATHPHAHNTPQPGNTNGGWGDQNQNNQNPTQNPTQDPNQNPTQDPNAQNPTQNPTQDPNAQNPTQDPNGQNQNNQNQNNQNQGQNGQQQQPPAPTGPQESDFVDIKQVPPNLQVAARGRNASRGSFTSQCGRNQNQHHNPDNFIVAPGVSNGAHHTHDYVGNLTTDGFSTDQSLQASGTTCRNGDKSAYFWPVVRRIDQGNQQGADGNVGNIQLPVVANLRFKGNAKSKVVAMPKFLRVITGDAKAGTNGPANAKAAWTCTGFGNRRTTKYPLCPSGQRVARVLNFASCWDGQNTDSANHRTHIVFPDATTGRCPVGTKAVPQLQMTLLYNLPNRAKSFALDSFPEQLHNPLTDHADFENVMPNSLMRRAVFCINTGRNC